MFMQSIAGRKWTSYSAKLVFTAVPAELIASVPKGTKKRASPPNPSLLELTTFHVKR
jgi:hypothetical protein